MAGDDVLYGLTFLRLSIQLLYPRQQINSPNPCLNYLISKSRIVLFCLQSGKDNNYRIKIKYNMELQLQDLLEFCSYYTLTKTASHLSHSSQPPQQLQRPPPPQKSTKIARKKVEVAPKKIAKPKMEFPSRIPKKSVSPNLREQFREVEEDRKNKYDLNYFVSHLAKTSTAENPWNIPVRRQQHQQSYHNRPECSLYNYETFGRSGHRPIEYQTFESKMKNTQRTPLTDRYAYTDRNQKVDYAVSQFYARPDPKKNNIDHNPWTHSPQTTQRPTAKSQFIEIEAKRPNYYGPPPFEFNYKPSQSKLTCSPNRRQFTPSNSNVNYSPSNLSKSRTKNQRKKIQRPMYDPSKLTIKKETQSLEVRQNIFEQKNLAQSFVSVDETHSYTYPRKMAEDNKRETSTTAPPLRTNRQAKPQLRHQLRNQTDLDDALGQTLTQLSQRQAPVALEVRMHER